MKILAVIVLAVIVAVMSAKGEEGGIRQRIDKPSAFHEREKNFDRFSANGELAELKEISSSTPKKASILGGLHGIPSCKLGPRWGNPICFIKCLFRRHAGGWCRGNTCTCVE